jgi:hypothetical protein
MPSSAVRGYGGTSAFAIPAVPGPNRGTRKWTFVMRAGVEQVFASALRQRVDNSGHCAFRVFDYVFSA